MLFIHVCTCALLFVFINRCCVSRVRACRLLLSFLNNTRKLCPIVYEQRSVSQNHNIKGQFRQKIIASCVYFLTEYWRMRYRTRAKKSSKNNRSRILFSSETGETGSSWSVSSLVGSVQNLHLCPCIVSANQKVPRPRFLFLRHPFSSFVDVASQILL